VRAVRDRLRVTGWRSPCFVATMPLYELVCLARPRLERADMVKMMQRVGALVMDRGGVLTRIQSYGEQRLATDIRRPFERYSEVRVVPHALTGAGVGCSGGISGVRFEQDRAPSLRSHRPTSGRWTSWRHQRLSRSWVMSWVWTAMCCAG
jgi:hypothetical protein